MAAPFPLLEEAIRLLSLEPDEQRRELHGAVVTDELALDLENAVSSIAYAEEVAGMELPAAVRSEVERLAEMLNLPPGDDLWNDEALDRHPTWATAREIARAVHPLLPRA